MVILTEMGGCYTRPRVVAHEFGHAYWNGYDEYVYIGGIPQPQCGHSNMADAEALNQYNYCTGAG